MDENNTSNIENNNSNEYQNNENQPNEQMPETNVNNDQNQSFTNVNQNQFFKNIDEEPKAPEEKSNWYWLIYVGAIIIIFIIILLLLRGCNGLRNKNQSKVLETNDWVTNMWNKCVDPVYWYTAQGTGVNGAEINIDSVLNDCDTYYNEYKNKKSEITGLSDEYSDFKEIYAKISEQIDIIYPKIKENKPVSEGTVDYEENMNILYENQQKLYDLIKTKYYKGE